MRRRPRAEKPDEQTAERSKPPEEPPEETPAQETPARETPARDEPVRVIDPVHVLLSGMSRVESRVPWVPVAIVVLALLWLPTLPRLGSDPIHPAETEWVADALTPWETSSGGSAFSRTLTRATWEWQGAEVEGPAQLDRGGRQAIRFPSAAASLVALVIFFFLARLVTGPAGAVLAAALLAACAPWTRAGTSALPLVVGEMMVLLGVVWALTLQSRHREVGIATVTAGRVGIAGVFLGLGILLTPASVATFIATLLVWFFVALRRTRFDATTLPVADPKRSVVVAVMGTVVLLVGFAAAVWGAERLAGGRGWPVLFAGGDSLAAGVSLWAALYRGLLSPGPTTDVVLVVALGVIAVVRALEWTDGRTWQAAGLAPWVFLGVWIVAVVRDHPELSTLLVPVTVPPLFVLGFGWMLLRGLHPGRFRRQEYAFVVVWLTVGLLLVPLVPGSHRQAPHLAAALTLLPVVCVLAARGVRALWEAEKAPLARTGIFVFAYLPIALFFAVAMADAAGVPVVRAGVVAAGRWLPAALLVAAGLGALSQIIHVRPDAPTSVRSPRRRRSGARRPKSRRRPEHGGRPGSRRRPARR